MLLLSNTTSTLSLVTGSAGAVSVQLSYTPITVATQTVTNDIGANSPSITGAATSVLIGSGSILPGAPGSPGTGVAYNIAMMTIRNTHATVSNAIQVLSSDGTNSAVLFAAVLPAGYGAHLDTFGRFEVRDTNGAIVTTLIQAPQTLVTFSSGTSISPPSANSNVRCTSTTAGTKTVNMPAATGSMALFTMTDAGSLAANPTGYITAASASAINGQVEMVVIGTSLSFRDVSAGQWDSV